MLATLRRSVAMLTPDRCSPPLDPTLAARWWPVARGDTWVVARPRDGVTILLTTTGMDTPPSAQHAREVADALNRIYSVTEA